MCPRMVSNGWTGTRNASVHPSRATRPSVAVSRFGTPRMTERIDPEVHRAKAALRPVPHCRHALDANVDEATTSDLEDGLDASERDELVRHRCFVRGKKTDGDLWPYEAALVEPL